MRYPGTTHQERVFKRVIFIIALLLFVSSFSFAAKRKFSAASLVLPEPTPTYPTSPLVSPTGSTQLRLFDSATNKPLSNQNIALIITSTCDSQTMSCPSSDPIVLTSTSDGSIIVSQQTMQQKPKLYAAGYKTDRYFTFLSTDPAIVTVYNPPTDAKTTYDITKEIVPVGLTPVAP